jgi:peptide/nickel transport system substrate-binding protein
MIRSFLVVMLALAALLPAQSELRFALRSDPATLDPALVEDEPSELIRYLTGGVLIRLNRVTQALQGELATSWSQSPDGRRLTLKLRRNVRFSDGSPFDADDVVHTFRVLTAPQNRNPTADAFRSGDKPPAVERMGDHEVAIVFPTPVASAARLMDQVAVVSSRSKSGVAAVLGPFRVAEHKRGSHLLLERNSQYWKKDSTGRQLPYIDRIRIPIQPNRELEALAFRRGELHLISRLDSRIYENLGRELGDRVHDVGGSFDTEFLWFNLSPAARIPQHKKDWFHNLGFRKAVSAAIDRADLCRIVYKGHALPAVGFHSPANTVWFNRSIKLPQADPAAVRKLFADAGFTESGGVLKDAKGNPVAFTILTNSANRAREQVAALIQRDLKRFGIQVTIATLDFGALLERIGTTQAYEVCLLGLVNIDRDPNGIMNVLLSSGANHPWNPGQSAPATPWEAEIDRLMRAQAANPAEKARVAHFHRVQAILAEQEPCVFLLHPNVLAAWQPELKNVRPAALRPNLLWSVEYLYFGDPRAGEAPSN